jgi:hypothetical protein
MASLVQAILHGLTMQIAVDPKAFDREEMVSLCSAVLGTYLWGEKPEENNGGAGPEKKPAPSATNNKRRRALGPRGIPS